MIRESMMGIIDGLIEFNNVMKMEEFHDCASHPLGSCECIGMWVGFNKAVAVNIEKLKHVKKVIEGGKHNTDEDLDDDSNEDLMKSHQESIRQDHV